MNKLYDVIPLSNSVFNCLIIAKTIENPCKELVESGTKGILDNGILLFDLAIPHDLGKYRFAYARVIDSHIVKDTLKYSAAVDADILGISQKYFQEHADLVDKALMPATAKHRLLNGVII